MHVAQLLLAAAIGLIIGAACAWLYAAARAARVQVLLQERVKDVTQLRALLEQTDTRLRDSFAALSSQALQANNQAFLDLARTSMGEFHQGAKAELEARQLSIAQLVQPVREGLLRVDEKLQALDRERTASHAALHEQLRGMVEAQEHLTGETQLLVRALRAPQVRGQWGEMQLRRVVELAGMIEHCDFEEQETVQGEDGRLRPDMIVHLPGDKVIVVDSKAPLAAYLDAIDAVTDEQRAPLLDQHARQVRDHITQLAGKEYADQFTQTPDFVVMFLPGEAFFSAACHRDPGLIEFAVQHGVIPASPTTLITVLKAVFYGWQQERIARNSEQIRDLGMELYTRMRVAAEHLARVRKGLDGAVSAYNAAVSSLESRVLPTARKFRELGVGTGDEIEALEPVDAVPRLAAAPELVAANAPEFAAHGAPEYLVPGAAELLVPGAADPAGTGMPA